MTTFLGSQHFFRPKNVRPKRIPPKSAAPQKRGYMIFWMFLIWMFTLNIWGEDESHYWEIFVHMGWNHQGVMTFSMTMIDCLCLEKSNKANNKICSQFYCPNLECSDCTHFKSKKSPTKQIQVRNGKIIILELLTWFIFTFYHNKSPFFSTS